MTSWSWVRSCLVLVAATILLQTAIVLAADEKNKAAVHPQEMTGHDRVAEPTLESLLDNIEPDFDTLGNSAYKSKRSIASAARSGFLNRFTKKFNQNQIEDGQGDAWTGGVLKKSLASLARQAQRTGSSLFGESRGSRYQGKRNIASLARQDGLRRFARPSWDEFHKPASGAVRLGFSDGVEYPPVEELVEYLISGIDDNKDGSLVAERKPRGHEARLVIIELDADSEKMRTNLNNGEETAQHQLAVDRQGRAKPLGEKRHIGSIARTNMFPSGYRSGWMSRYGRSWSHYYPYPSYVYDN